MSLYENLRYVMNLYHLLTNMGLYEKTVLQNPVVDDCSSCSLLKWPVQGMFRIFRHNIVQLFTMTGSNSY